MEMYLQMGWGMMGHSQSLIEEWGGGTAILSPRDTRNDQFDKLSQAIRNLPDGNVLLDPQTYLPDADHERLIGHDYWVSDYVTGTLFSGPQLTHLLSKLKELNDRLETRGVILPGILAQEITSDWLDANRMIHHEAEGIGFERPLIQTVALSSDACRSNAQVAQLLEYIEQHRCEKYYLVCEHPEGKYLVDDVAWLTNLLDIVAGMKLLRSEVIVGYASHQLLATACAKADAIASGTWMNVRAFPPEKFRAQYDDEVKRKAIWYYASPLFSEYKIATLDGAKALGVLDRLESPHASERVEAMFTGAQPTTIGLTEGEAFQHYLRMLQQQASSAVKETFDETVAAYEELLDEAETRLTEINALRINGQLRDFSLCLDTNRLALQVLRSTRGGMLRYEWQSI